MASRVMSRLVDAELRQRLVDGLLNGFFGDGVGHVWFSLVVSAAQADMPPSTYSVVPVTYPASSEARNRTAAATSSGVP